MKSDDISKAIFGNGLYSVLIGCSNFTEKENKFLHTRGQDNCGVYQAYTAVRDSSAR